MQAQENDVKSVSSVLSNIDKDKKKQELEWRATWEMVRSGQRHEERCKKDRSQEASSVETYWQEHKLINEKLSSEIAKLNSDYK